MTLQEPDCHEKLPSELKVPEDPNLHPCCPTLAENPYLQLGVSSFPRPILSVLLGGNSPGPCRNKVWSLVYLVIRRAAPPWHSASQP